MRFRAPDVDRNGNPLRDPATIPSMRGDQDVPPQAVTSLATSAGLKTGMSSYVTPAAKQGRPRPV